jgi:hypothetical protein
MVARRPHHLLRLAVLAVMSVCGLTSESQTTPSPEVAMRRIIVDFQQGTVNWNYVALPLKQTIYLQTNGTGFYPQLTALGPPTKVKLLSTIPLPAGFYRTFRVDFNAGGTVWEIAQDFQGVIWGLSFQPAGPEQQPSSSAPETRNDSDKPAETKGGGNTPSKTPTNKSNACKLYPNLCQEN